MAGGHRATRHLSLAAYVKMRGLKLMSVRRERNDKAKFIFDDPDAVFEQLRVDFANSESARHDDEVRGLKQMMNGRSS